MSIFFIIASRNCVECIRTVLHSEMLAFVSLFLSLSIMQTLEMLGILGIRRLDSDLMKIAFRDEGATTRLRNVKTQ